MDRRRFLAAAGAAASLTFAGCGGASGRDDFDVGMTGTAFKPAGLAVSVGDEVTWKNTSTRDHTVTAYGGKIPDGAAYFATGGYESARAARDAWDGANGAITSGEYFRHTFETPGTYTYFCIPHEQAGMVGTVTVER